MNERNYLAFVSSFIPFGPVRINLLLSYFGSAEGVWNATQRDLRKVGLGESLVNGFLTYRRNFGQRKYLEKLKKFKVGFVTVLDEGYPENLKGLPGVPLTLYFKGNIKNVDGKALAIVGSRRVTLYGGLVTERFTKELVKSGVSIVSGLARGIDTLAHKTALINGGKTIAVLAGGLDILYPPENLLLAKEIVKKGGLLISEYPLGYPLSRVNFARRNRIISGLSRGILVVEGAAKSGSLLTASGAAEQGRAVFAIPGDIFSFFSAAPHFLIKNGARLVTEPKEIIEELFPENENKEFSEEEKILNLLGGKEMSLDRLSKISSLDKGSLSARLTIMEVKGLIKKGKKGGYKKI